MAHIIYSRINENIQLKTHPLRGDVQLEKRDVGRIMSDHLLVTIVLETVSCGLFRADTWLLADLVQQVSSEYHIQ